MAKTLDDVLSEARLMLKDRREPFRYTQTDVLESINCAFREAKRLRPDLFTSCCTGTDTELPDFQEADLEQDPATEFPIDEAYFVPIVYYTVGKLQLGDDEFNLDNRAMTLLGTFRQQLLGG